MSQASKILFIGFLDGATLLVSLSPNFGKYELVGTAIVMGIVGVVYGVNHLAGSMTTQDGSSDRVEAFLQGVIAVFALPSTTVLGAYLLQKAKGSWRDGWFKATVAIIISAGLVAGAITFMYPVDTERSVETDLILRSETTGDVWVIEAERKDESWNFGVDRDTVYLASATILALATFGSVLAVVVSGRPETHKPKRQGASMMFAGVGAVIILQFLIMYGACCSNFDAGYFFILLLFTATALAIVASGFALLLDSWFTSLSKTEA